MLKHSIASNILEGSLRILRQGAFSTPALSSLMAGSKAIDGDGGYLTIVELRQPSTH